MRSIATIETNFTIIENSSTALFIRFDLTNKSSSDIKLLKRFTPLEGIRSDCIFVDADGNNLKYDGYRVKRGAPSPSEYLVVRSNETVSNIVDIGTAYDISSPKTYTISFDISRLKVFLLAGIGDSKIDLISAPSETVAENKTLIVSRNFTDATNLTIGHQMRLESSYFELKATVLNELREPLILGGTEIQKREIEKAHKNCYQYTKTAINKLANNKKYSKWFGEYTDSRVNKVLTTFVNIKKRMERTQFSYQINGRDCAEDEYGYTTDGSAKIWLCNAFWEAPDHGYASKAGTLVHEHSHASAYTEDIEYTIVDCLALAESNPDKATINADNYEFYVESHFVS